MESLYLLNNHVYFNAVSGMLSPSLCFSRKVTLSKPASHCLKLLIAKQGEICHYPYLSHQIWGERGKWMSNNTIHQHIYQLRNHLKKAGLEKEAIITIPRKGFQLCPKFRVAPITAENLSCEQEAITQTAPERPRPGAPFSTCLLYALVVFNAMVTLLLTIKSFML
ncbi:winged helix-turn-helix domain-containing protein [Kluyvera ascorbata]|uniref:winged helix-turn-helix domain-containing protein n=1 Tax=Kluyvera ascorbata TaxID=51288 RepID=UPI002897B18A|nr:winged helix-turn-helix domain-containing protein [Kluyvera ascorbata]MEB6388630.1 winged helix-turn-helix domain-containing protein [Kluyvera ascorbata]HDG1677839.1 winged helix-turn-helix domain-containing protein [Kluyvera ascorbata]HED3067518.1 winged helix-turn-helix domain-containing protein [Kluyvera ascorbata]